VVGEFEEVVLEGLDVRHPAVRTQPPAIEDQVPEGEVDVPPVPTVDADVPPTAAEPPVPPEILV